MGRSKSLVGAFGAGAGLLSLIVGATCLLRADAMGSWLLKEDRETRARRSWLAAEKRARLASSYVDACRAAGL